MPIFRELSTEEAVEILRRELVVAAESAPRMAKAFMATGTNFADEELRNLMKHDPLAAQREILRRAQSSDN